MSPPRDPADAAGPPGPLRAERRPARASAIACRPDQLPRRRSAPALAQRRSTRYPLSYMVQFSPTRLDASFAALSDATRRGVLEQLGRSEASISELAETFHMT